MKYIFSKLTPKDAEHVFEIEKDLIGDCSLETILNTISNEKLNYYVLKNNDEVVGFFELLVISPDCELYDIAVKKEYQGQGLSKILMDNLLKIARENLCATIFLEVNSINNKAINLYKKYGFESYFTRKNYYGDSDAVLMKLVL